MIPNEKDINNTDLTRESKPLIKLRTVKTSLKKILKDDDNKSNQNILLDAVNRTHKIVIHTYQFIRLYILNNYHKKQEIPVINKDFILMVFNTLTTKSKGGNTPKGENLKLLKNLERFYISDYKKLGYKNKICGTNLSQILRYMNTDILTNIENNIKMHFFSYVKRFVNSLI